MQELLELILTNITTNPDDVNIETHEEGDQIVYTITVNPEDMGRVIGKNGKVIRAIRSLAHVVGIRKNERYRVNVAEVGQASETDEATDQEELDTDQVNQDSQVNSPSDSEPESTSAPEVKDDVIAGAIDFDQPDTTDSKSE